jgi:hypothetical protein
MRDLTMKNFLRIGLLVSAWFVGIIGGLGALVNALEQPPKIADTIGCIVVGGGASLIYLLLYRYITNRWDAMGGWGRFFVTLPCLAIFAGPLLSLTPLLLVAAAIYAFFGPHGAAEEWSGGQIPGGRDATLRSINRTLRDIDRKL